ncbi:MAG TPA: bis(5'-nucleosyl)-tetraphosphatase (symmetrical) YqeK [Dehalococcoidia bacterium]|nr:bis(5'-nucleosyl)-tetraphosphatase (symmetrical) YqeK [Dehalococcoidia bacterium]
MPEDLETRLRRAVAQLPHGLRDHVLRVEQEALRLAELHGLDAARIRIAALGHDLVRHKRGPELLRLAAEYALEPDEVEREAPILVHGPVAARILRRDYALADEEVLAGIDCHTTGRAGMTALEKALFVADKVEPEKRAGQPALEAARDAAASDLDAAMLLYLDFYLGEAVRRRHLLHPRTLEARNELIRTLKPPAS